MPQTPTYKKVGAHNMTAKHNFAKLVTLVTNLVSQKIFSLWQPQQLQLGALLFLYFHIN